MISFSIGLIALAQILWIPALKAEDQGAAEPTIESLGLPVEPQRTDAEVPTALSHQELPVEAAATPKNIAESPTEEAEIMSEVVDNLDAPIVDEPDVTNGEGPSKEAGSSKKASPEKEKKTAGEIDEEIPWNEVETKVVEERPKPVSKYPTKLIINVTMSRANIQYALKKKKYGRMKSLGSKGLLVKDVTPESLLENLALEKGDVVVACNGKDLVGRAGMQELIKVAQESTKFQMIVVRKNEYLLFKMQQ